MSKKKSGGMKGIKKFFYAVLILLVITVVLIGIDIYLKVFTPYAGYSGSVSVTIPRGASAASIARMLYREKIIGNYTYFRAYYRLIFNKVEFKSGEYVFDKPMTMKEVIDKLNEGKVVLYKITIKEGLSIPEVAEIVSNRPPLHISADEFTRIARSPELLESIRLIDPKARDLEGYLFPDTYMVRRDVTTRDMVHMMVDRFKENFTDKLKWRADEIKLDVREVITLASLIEKETASRDERFLISSVFHNRLRIGMLLDCDPTIIYALKRDRIYDGKLGWNDLKYDSPYNTRLYRGLPPGPICNPGAASIEAALYPATSKYLYFVAKNPGAHYFSESLEEHNRAVRKYIINHQKE
jgi:UPF0755 protein